MLRRGTFALAVFAALAALTGVGSAHHGWGGFDASKALDLTAPVLRSTYANPHGTLQLMHERREVTIELAPTGRMEARGLTAQDIAPGRTVRVYAYQNRGNPAVYRAEWIEADGRRVELR